MQEGKTIQSVAKAMTLLEVMAASRTPLTLAELSTATGYPKSTVHGLLSTLREFSAVDQDTMGRYGLGVRLFEYGCALSGTWPVLEAAKPFIQHVSYETGETVFLSMLDRGEVITIAHADNRTGIPAEAEVGCRLPAHCTSQGKLFLALMGAEKQEQLLKNIQLKAYTANTITTVPALHRELMQIRLKGYAVENGEYKTGLRSVSAPIFGSDGTIQYALGIIGMARQMETEHFEKAIALICETAAKLTEQLA